MCSHNITLFNALSYVLVDLIPPFSVCICSLLVSCSQDCLNWSILPPADGALMMRAGLLRGRFSGDPSFVYEHTVSHRTGEGEGAHEETTTVEMKEEDRVAAVVATIEEEVGIVPQGAVMKTPTGVVKSNKAFEGVACLYVLWFVQVVPRPPPLYQ